MLFSSDIQQCALEKGRPKVSKATGVLCPLRPPPASVSGPRSPFRTVKCVWMGLAMFCCGDSVQCAVQHGVHAQDVKARSPSRVWPCPSHARCLPSAPPFFAFALPRRSSQQCFVYRL